jgi:ATP-dependent Clp protease adapter protein ClpS
MPDSTTNNPANSDHGGNTAVAEPKQNQKSSPKPKLPGFLPQWKVLLHNDDKNEMLYVIVSIVELTPLKPERAQACTIEAHKTGISLLLITHKERAELYQEQFQSKGLTVTIEPAEEG